MSEQMLAPSEEALQHYRRHRKRFPLPEGWSESDLHAPAANGRREERHVYIENDQYLVDLKLDHFDDPPWCNRAICVLVLRKDGRTTTKREAVQLVKSLLGDDSNPHLEDYWVVVPAPGGETAQADGACLHARPLRYLMGEDAIDPDGEDDQYAALAFYLPYPPCS